ncbi:SpdD protein [Streptomyces sp. Qhu-G9]|uniref:SpdD protein n=1 Tax=Streptomyces sp. Qhu-G9 TaxID=3452799 RepID=UPI0022ABD75C|nr:SpdD protein [Streptomyces aurantiacus]WAU78760.1 SpdD protein [Streptomyces aurantiacus]
MFRPKLPDAPPLPTTVTTHQHLQAPAAPFAGRQVAPYVGVGAGAVAAVVVVGVVLTALLAAVAITAISVAISAVVLRSLVNGANTR